MSGERLYTDVEKFVFLKDAYDWPPAMAEGQRGKGVFIGIIDTGVNILHSAFLTTDAPPRRARQISRPLPAGSR